MIEKQAKKKIYHIATLLLTALFFLYPTTTLVAEYYHWRASSILKKVSRESGRARITERNIQHYLVAIRLLKAALSARASDSRHHKAVSELYLRIGIWAMAMETMNAPLPSGLLSSKDFFVKADAALKTAITLEPTNPDYHFALGTLYDILDKYNGLSEKELSRAIVAYPINASLRYAVALQHLKSGRRGDALEHATALAMLEGSSPSEVSPGWLFKAFEIAWRATEDSQVVQGISPETPQALKVLKQYLEWKRIKQ